LTLLPVIFLPAEWLLFFAAYYCGSCALFRAFSPTSFPSSPLLCTASSVERGEGFSPLGGTLRDEDGGHKESGVLSSHRPPMPSRETADHGHNYVFPSRKEEEARARERRERKRSSCINERSSGLLGHESLLSPLTSIASADTSEGGQHHRKHGARAM